MYTRVLRRKSTTQRDTTPRAIRHEFAIGPAGPDDPFEGKGQRYTCIRCKWAFVVKGRHVVVLDDDGTLLAGDRALARLDTFAQGPCAGIRAQERRLPQLQIIGKPKA